MSSKPSTARIFMSYDHADQKGAYTGDLRRFAEDVVDALDGVHDVKANLIFDTKDGTWGEDLWARIDVELETATFLMPFLTPRWFGNDNCRFEFTRFADAAERKGRVQLVLPLLWIPYSPLTSGEPGDEIVEKLRRIRFLDCTDAHNAERGSNAYSAAIGIVAAALEKVIRELGEEGVVSAPTDIAESDAEPTIGLDELLVKIEDTVPEVMNEVESFLESFKSFGETFQEAESSFQTGSARQLQASMLSLAQKLKGAAGELQKRANSAASDWDALIGDLNLFARLAREVGSPIDADVLQGLREMERSMRDIKEDDLPELQQIANQMPKLSASLGPSSKALDRSARTLRSMHTSLADWLAEVEGHGSH